jgi:uncharacterized protein (TIGR00730 family)
MMEGTRMNRLAVYCGSATPADPRYMESARHLGRTFAERGIGLVYGGGRLGLMGAIADSFLAAGGAVIGVIPRALAEAEVAHRGLTELHVVETMHERKQAFADLADGFVTLPGGTGTMDELWEAMSWAQLGYHAKPVGLLNVAGYYDGLLAFWTRMAETGFVRPQHSGLLIAGDDLDDLLARMAAHVPPRALVTMSAEEL